jgi:hypothetical protein
MATNVQGADQYNHEMEVWKAENEHGWKLYDASQAQIDILMRRQGEEFDKLDKWVMTMAAGSFGLSFAFINNIVKLEETCHIPLLISAWSCFLAVLAVGVIGFIISGLRHTILANEEAKSLPLKYEGKEPEYKKRSIFFDANAVIGYAQIALFIGGSVCLIMFIAQNLL